MQDANGALMLNNLATREQLEGVGNVDPDSVYDPAFEGGIEPALALSTMAAWSGSSVGSPLASRYFMPSSTPTPTSSGASPTTSGPWTPWPGSSPTASTKPTQ